MPANPTARRSRLYVSTSRKLDRLANSLPNRLDSAKTMDRAFEIALQAVPLRMVRDALDLAFQGWGDREIEDQIGRDLTSAEAEATEEERAAALTYKIEIMRAEAHNASKKALEAEEERKWLAALCGRF